VVVVKVGDAPPYVVEIVIVYGLDVPITFVMKYAVGVSPDNIPPIPGEATVCEKLII
jgi:hypothetical protein